MSELHDLWRRVLDPPRSGSPDAARFAEDMESFAVLVGRLAVTLPEDDLVRLAGLPDVSRDVLYYLADDPLYDAGHDVAQADFSAVRGVAARELARRGQKVPQGGGS
jgi:hypothetical protein